MKRQLVITVVFLFGQSLLFSQSEEKKDISTGVACTDFDFLWGEWDIVNPQTGAPTGTTATIQGPPTHCYLTMIEKGPRLGEGLCVVAYANSTHDWEQVCASMSGGRFNFTSGIRHGNEVSFIVHNQREAPGTTRHRFGFILLPDGTVKEFQEASYDNGKTWPKIEMNMLWKRHKTENQ